MILLMMIIARAKKRGVLHVTKYRLSASFPVRSGYGGGKTSSPFVAHDVAQLADSCISGTYCFGISVLAVDHRNTRTHHKSCRRRVAIEPHCRPSVGLSIRGVTMSDFRCLVVRGYGIYGIMALIIT